MCFSSTVSPRWEMAFGDIVQFFLELPLAVLRQGRGMVHELDSEAHVCAVDFRDLFTSGRCRYNLWVHVFVEYVDVDLSMYGSAPVTLWRVEGDGNGRPSLPCSQVFKPPVEAGKPSLATRAATQATIEWTPTRELVLTQVSPAVR